MTAVFSGAGLSGTAPANLPLGNRLRNDVLAVVFEGAQRFERERRGQSHLLADRASLESLFESRVKLEVVIGRLSGTVGEVGRECLLALRIALPNEAHMLAALHLITGGFHATLNLDVGIEVAYDLLTHRSGLHFGLPEAFAEALPEWRSWIPRDTPALEVVCEEEDFQAWTRRGQPRALLKLHGSLDRAQTALRSPVVVDTDQLRQLSPARLAGLRSLGAADGIVVTGYSGEDIDVYLPLLDVLAAKPSTWTALAFLPGSQVPDDLAQRNIPSVVGKPQGLATTVLREILGLRDDALPWPQLHVPGSSYRKRFEQWVEQLRRQVSNADLAETWAWLQADLGDYDSAVAILDTIPDPHPRSKLRLAEALYQRGSAGDRHRAGRLYRALLEEAQGDRGLRAHSLLRLGDISRGEALRGRRRLLSLAGALSAPVRVLVLTARRSDLRELQADAFRALQQTLSRMLEVAASRRGAIWRPALGAACHGAALLGRRSETLTTNGNRASFVRQQRLGLLGLAALLLGRTPNPAWVRALESTRTAYMNGNDIAGAANCTASLALHRAAEGNRIAARRLLDEAEILYARSRPGAPPPPSGVALVERMRAILDVTEPAGDW